MRHHVQPVRCLLADIHADVLHFAVLQQVFAAFIDQELGIFQQVALILDEPVRPRSLRLFVRDGKKNHVAIERHFLALQHHHHHQLRQAFILHVLRAASPDVAIFDSLR